ncbi:hypothetical protein WAF17_16675 [Bernardetia sp. ABR2-2B]|uniref:hypothetical protein n=1 Tax=Bernardetia sp. ABR2-2B TaxID=3127472 RepID=UPI0030D0B1EF
MKYKPKSKVAVFEFYEEISEEMDKAYFCGDSTAIKERAIDNRHHERFDNHLKINCNDENPSNDLLRELHSICQEPEISRKMDIEILRIATDELEKRREKAKEEAQEVYRKLMESEPTQTEQVA